MNCNGDFNFDLIEIKYYRILSDYIKRPTFDESSESPWNSKHERQLCFFEDYSDELYNLKTIKNVSDCLKGLELCLKEKKKYENILRVQMQKFVVEMVKMGMNPIDVLNLSSVYPYWARYFHIFAHVKFVMYSPRAHFISLMVQELELINLYQQKLHMELLEALHFSQNRRREYFIDIIIQKRKLMSEDSNFFKRVQKEVPELPLGVKIQTKYLDFVIDRIKKVIPTVEEMYMDKHNENLFKKGIKMAIKKQMEKEREQELRDEMELRKMQEEFKRELEKEELLEWQKETEEWLDREIKEDFEEWIKKNSKKDKNS